MGSSVATGEVLSKEPHLPPMHRVGELLAPTAPQDVAGARLEEGTLADLALKLAATTPRLTTEWLSKRLHLSGPLAGEVLDQLCREVLVEESMMGSQGRAQYRITQRGREQAARSLEICSYIGPAP